MLIATIPAPFQYDAWTIAHIPEIDAFRFNTGVPVPDPLEALQNLLKIIPTGKKLWVDLKCRQLRVINWADPSFSEIELNREIEVSHPAKIYLRGDVSCYIADVKGNKIFLEDPPQTCVGKGQSVNILADNLQIKGPLLNDLDWKYIHACQQLGIKGIMASFVESWEDVSTLASAFSEGIYLKIENALGLSTIVNSTSPLGGIHLELARDDLFTQLSANPKRLLQATHDTIVRDPQALVASKFFSTLTTTGEITLADMEDIIYLHHLGYRDFMFQDGLSKSVVTLRKAVEYFYRCIEWAQEKR
jgi:hypothetical protein